MLDEALEWPGSQEAIQAFGKEFAASSDFGKAWDVLVETAQKNGSGIALNVVGFSLVIGGVVVFLIYRNR